VGHAGRGLGKALLDFARSQAERRGCNWLRLDCVGDNEGLKIYYKYEGFTLVKSFLCLMTTPKPSSPKRWIA
jgi:GNAT superfamily N-acetyltransferase